MSEKPSFSIGTMNGEIQKPNTEIKKMKTGIDLKPKTEKTEKMKDGGITPDSFPSPEKTERQNACMGKIRKCINPDSEMNDSESLQRIGEQN